jgi:radical SAM protein with 4Fe4S-binding SPASM domain
MSDKEKDYYENYNYNDRKPVFIDEKDLRSDQVDRLTKSDVFCMIPWIHMHAFPDGRAYPCCLGEGEYPIGNFKQDSMATVWNQAAYKTMRKNMLEGKPCKECNKCYEQEQTGFISMRNSTNKNFGQHIGLIDQTKPDGTYEDFKLRYYDIRFSNLCNFTCRTCGGWFSSSWYTEEEELYGKRNYPKIMFAGRTESDMWEQLEPHISYLEQVYFAGGEPMMMEEHYRILKELVKREMFEVKLIYNTNFSRLSLKDDNVLDLWPLFKNVSIGASLDGMGPRAEYIRKGTRWDQIERNREDMLLACPTIDFYVSSTVSLYNAMHITDFHRTWVAKGYVKPQDWNVNILQGPERDRIDVLPQMYKEQITAKVQKHIDWLRPQDHLQRATSGYEGMLRFMNATDNSHLLEEFFRVNDIHDNYRGEYFETVFPEYISLRYNYAT